MFRVRKESLKWGEMLEIPTVGLLNDYIVHHGIHDLILIQEALPGKENCGDCRKDRRKSR